MTIIKTTVQGNLTSASTAANETFTSEFSNMHQNTTGVIVKQTTSGILERKTSKIFMVTFVHSGILFFKVTSKIDK